MQDLRHTPQADWLARVERGRKPMYLAIADALLEEVRTGRLTAGARLPPQRAVAEALEIDLTTVTRAFAEAQRRGLVASRVGQGSFIAATAAEPPLATARGGAVDMSMNLPPQFDDAALARRMWRGLAELEQREGLPLLLRYQSAAGGERDRRIGAVWLTSRLPGVGADRMVVAAGAQAALVGVMSNLARPGDVICTERLTYPGLRTAAAHLGLEVVGVEMDAEGVLPDAFERTCRRFGPKLICCTPTLQNPTTATMSLARRAAIVAVARRHRVAIVEDDAYGRLPDEPPPALAALAPEIAYHIAGCSKVLSPALRIAYVAAPDAAAAARVAASLRATTGMASPLTSALAARWIESGTAAAVLAAIRDEAKARRALAARILGPAVAQPAEAFHLWLQLPQPWTRAAFQAALHAFEVAVVPSDAFAVGGETPEAVRIGLGAAPTRADAERALEAIRQVLDRPPAWSAGYV